MPRISALGPITVPAQDDELPIVDVSESTTKKVTVGQLMPVGSILDFAGTSAPSGWLLCYGQTLDAQTNTEYQALYDIIGNTYGGSSNADFVVPDLRGRATAGKDDMGGSSANRLTDIAGSLDGDVLGDSGGSESYSLANANLPRYNHGVQMHGAGSATVMSGVVGGSAGLSAMTTRTNYRTGGANTAGANSIDGFSLNIGQTTPTPVTTVQPTIILNKIIRY